VRAYVAVTGIAFALLVAAHVARVVLEGRGVANAFFVAITVAAAAVSVWAWRLLRANDRPA
jgi:ABC-type sugar transport system permease subunit